jgi:hypothetical protein
MLPSISDTHVNFCQRASCHFADGLSITLPHPWRYWHEHYLHGHTFIIDSSTNRTVRLSPGHCCRQQHPHSTDLATRSPSMTTPPHLAGAGNTCAECYKTTSKEMCSAKCGICRHIKLCKITLHMRAMHRNRLACRCSHENCPMT